MRTSCKDKSKSQYPISFDSSTNSSQYGDDKFFSTSFASLYMNVVYAVHINPMNKSNKETNAYNINICPVTSLLAHHLAHYLAHYQVHHLAQPQVHNLEDRRHLLPLHLSPRLLLCTSWIHR